MQKCFTKRHLPNTSCLGYCPFWKLGSRMDAPILKKYVMDIRGSIWCPGCFSRVPPPLQKPKSGTNTVANPDLSTPDELEDDNMRVLKLKSRLIRLGNNRDVFRKRYGWFFGFCTLRWRRPAAAHTALNQPYKKSKSQWECRKVLISRFAIAKSKSCPTVVQIVSAMVQLLCIHCLDAYWSVRTSFPWFRAVFAWFLTVFSYFGSVFDRFQGVEKRFRPVSTC